MNTRWEPIGLTDEEYAAMLRADKDARNRASIRPATPTQDKLDRLERDARFYRYLGNVLAYLLLMAGGALTVYVWQLVLRPH